VSAQGFEPWTFARRVAHVDTIPQQDSAERAFNKLARTFAAQVEALERYRTGGEQKMTVERVHPGGQAIVPDGREDGRRLSYEEPPVIGHFWMNVMPADAR